MRKSKYKAEQKSMRNFYDMQVEEKKRTKEYERYVDNNQAKIWKEDINKLTQHEKDVAEKVG